MTWSYTATSSGFTQQLNQVRLEIGDTVSTDPLMSDEEIAYAGTLEATLLSVSARCCEMISAHFARKADMTEGKLSIRLSQRAEAYAKKAEALRDTDAASGAVPYVGGISLADKQTNNDNTDRVKPDFFRGMLNNQEAQRLGPDSADGSDIE